MLRGYIGVTGGEIHGTLHVLAASRQTGCPEVKMWQARSICPTVEAGGQTMKTITIDIPERLVAALAANAKAQG